MKKTQNILIYGDGRIGRAVAYYLKKISSSFRPSFLSGAREVRDCDLLIGALPGEPGKQCLDLALKYRKNLIDISDIDPPFYKKRKKDIIKQGICVIPECGFSPGLVNIILADIFRNNSRVRNIEIKAGSLSSRQGGYPFLWCFEDLTAEHRMASRQLIQGKTVSCPAFGGFRKETFFGKKAETYYCASGFEQLLKLPGLKNFTTRVVRPEGFREFFKGLVHNGFLDKNHFYKTKDILESQKIDNMTFAEILADKEQWLIKSFSAKTEALNSMQKITATVPAAMAGRILREDSRRGLYFMEDFIKEPDFLKDLIRDIKKLGVTVRKMKRV